MQFDTHVSFCLQQGVWEGRQLQQGYEGARKLQHGVWGARKLQQEYWGGVENCNRGYGVDNCNRGYGGGVTKDDGVVGGHLLSMWSNSEFREVWK